LRNQHNNNKQRLVPVTA